MKELKFFKCAHCGNVVAKVVDKNVPVLCCGEIMKELVPNTTDAAQEKHVPVVEVNGNVVNVEIGSVMHPMEEGHFINFVALQTENGLTIKMFEPKTEPKTTFVADGKPVRVYEYCNLHGLWKKEL